MIYLYIAMSVAGAITGYWGLMAAHRFEMPWDSAAALVAMAGLVAFIAGILLATIPDFFVT